MNKIEDLVKELTPTKEERPKTYTAEVSHTDDEGVVWVRLPGAEQDTPTASTSTDVKMGDTVTVEWRNNKLYIAGNYTNPSAGVQRVSKVEQTAEKAMSDAGTAQAAADSAQETANAAITIAGDTDQHFWFTETGTDTGAHITEATQEDFLADPTNGGGNLLARSNGIAVRDGLSELASFSASGAQIGQNSQSHITISEKTIEAISQDQYEYWTVGDLIGGEISLVFESGREIYILPVRCVVGSETVTIGGVVQTSGYQFVERPSGQTIEFNDTTSGAVGLTYTADSTAPFFNFGSVGTNTAGAFSIVAGEESSADGVHCQAFGSGSTALNWYSYASGNGVTASGLASHAEGENTTASGRGSHAEGSQTTASGENSHAQNLHTTAAYSSQTAIGEFNDNKSSNLFEVGNGTASNNQNAFEVARNGTITVGGHSSPIGTIITGTRESTAGTATTSYTTAAHVDLTPGTWHIAAHNSFGSGTAGTRRVLITDNAQGDADAAFGGGTGYAPANLQILVRSELNVTITSNTTYYLRIKSQSQVASPYGNLVAVRIA